MNQQNEDQVHSLNAQIARIMRERDGWMESAAQFWRNMAFYRGLVWEIGEQFGEAAYTSDDGSKQQDVLCLKVPELTLALREKLAKAESRIAELQKDLDESWNWAAGMTTLAEKSLTRTEKAESALAAETQRHEFSISKWMQERKEMVEGMAQARAALAERDRQVETMKRALVDLVDESERVYWANKEKGNNLGAIRLSIERATAVLSPAPSSKPEAERP